MHIYTFILRIFITQIWAPTRPWAHTHTHECRVVGDFTQSPHFHSFSPTLMALRETFSLDDQNGEWEIRYKVDEGDTGLACVTQPHWIGAILFMTGGISFGFMAISELILVDGFIPVRALVWQSNKFLFILYICRVHWHFHADDGGSL